MPGIELPEHGFGEHRDPEPLVTRRIDEPLPGESVKGIADGSPGCFLVLLTVGGLEPLAGMKIAEAQLRLECDIDPLESRRERHGGR